MSTHVPGLQHKMGLKLHSYGHKTLDQAVNMVEINHVFINRFLFKKTATTCTLCMPKLAQIFIFLCVKGVCPEIFELYSFHDSNPSVPDKQGKVLLNSVSISLGYSITKFDMFDSVVCMTPQSKYFRFSKTTFYN